MAETSEAKSRVRVHIGGLAGDVSAQELRERFGRIATSSQCRLAAVELPESRLTPSQSKGFAYLTIEGPNAEKVFEDIAKAYNRTKWRGGVLRVALAKPDFQERLQSEWDARDAEQRKREEAVERERQRMQPADVIEEVHVGVEFEGKRTTQFDYSDLEWENHREGSQTDTESSEEEQQVDEEMEESEEEVSQDDEEEEDEVNPAAVVTASSESSEDEAEQSDASSSPPSPPASTQLQSTLPAKGPLSVEEANARRLAALQEKIKKQQDAAAAAKGFLGKIDVVGGATGKKITFDDDGEIEEVEDGRDVDDRGDDNEQLVTNKRAVADWMGSEDEEEETRPDNYGELDDEKMLSQALRKKSTLKTLEFDDGEELGDEEDAEDQQRFALRPEFLGESGKKLFEMQKRFGGDQRFRMDARFIEEEENEYFGHDGEEDIEPMADIDEAGFIQSFQGEEDDNKLAVYAEEMTRERDQALDVIAELFPDVDVEKIRYKLEALKNKDPIKEASWMGEQMRYDPRVSSTHKYELTVDDRSRKAAKDEDEKMAEEERRIAEEKRKRDEKEVLIGGDRFYSASSSLGSLFSRVRKNSEDGEVGEAALDGVFGFSKAADTKAESGDGEAAVAPSAFKLSSLFDFSFGGDSEKNKELAMGEDLLEAEDDDESKPWHFTQSFNENGGTVEDQPTVFADDDTDKEDDDVEGEEESADDDKPSKQKRVRVKRSLDDFLAFGRSFFNGPTLAALASKEAKDAWQKQWAERRKKLTLDFKRKRRDALKQKKKQQQALQRHTAKRLKAAK